MSYSSQDKDKDNLKFDPTCDPLDGQSPWDETLLIQLIRGKLASGKAKRQKLARDWFRAELFYNGVQWVTFDSKIKRWRETALKKNTPMPVTNTYASYADIFASLLASIPVEVTYRPLSSANDISQVKMKTANELSDAIEQKVKFKECQREAAPLLARQGEVFLIPRLVSDGKFQFETPQENKPKLNPSAILSSIVGGSVEAEGGVSHPRLKLLDQQSHSESSFPPREDALKEGDSLDHEASESPDDEATEEASGEELPGISKLVLDVVPAFEGYMDEEADDMANSAFFARRKSYDLSVLKQMYPKFKDRIHSAQKISGDISQYYAGSLSRLTSGEFGSSGYFIASPQSSTNRGNVTEFWHDPCPNYKKGLYAVMINEDFIAYSSDLPFKDEKGNHYKNVIHMRAKKRTKNIHGRTPLDDAIPKQVQRNKLESFIELIIYRMAAPHWLLPKDCGLESISGEPGTTIPYNRVSASQNAVLRPEMIQGVAPNSVLINWLEKIDNDTEYILGFTKALIGQLPPNTPAARALELLIQRSKERHGDVFAEWNAKWAEALNMLLKIVRQVKPLDLFKATKKTFGGFALRKFAEMDYDLDLEIVPETEQPAPARSTASELELIKDFSATGIWQMPAPQQYEILKRFGFSYLIKSMESDKEYIAREHYDMITPEVLPDGQVLPAKVPIVRPFDNHPLHFEDHRVFAQSEEFQDWAKAHPDEAMEFYDHVTQHQVAIQQQQQQQQPPAPPQGAQGGQQPMLAAMGGA